MAGSPSGYFQYRSPFGDTTLTKVFVGGLAWETPTEKMREYFEQFGEILEAVIICDKNTGKSKGYGFVTFRDPESAKRAVADANPMIDGRRANCNIAANGRPRQSPPQGRGQGQTGQIYYPGTQGGSSVQGPMVASPPVQPSVPLMYPPYGYTPYNPQYGYNQAAAALMYNQQLQQQQAQYYQQMYGSGSSSSTSPTMQQPPQHHPYYYALSMQAAAAAAAAASRAAAVTGGTGGGGAYPTMFQQAGQRGQNPYFYYTSPMATGSYSLLHPQQDTSAQHESTRLQELPSRIESGESSHVTSSEAEAKVGPSESALSD